MYGMEWAVASGLVAPFVGAVLVLAGWNLIKALRD